MKRHLFAVPFVGLLMLAGVASADYLRIKINVDFPLPPAGGPAGPGGPGFGPGGPGVGPGGPGFGPGGPGGFPGGPGGGKGFPGGGGIGPGGFGGGKGGIPGGMGGGFGGGFPGGGFGGGPGGVGIMGGAPPGGFMGGAGQAGGLGVGGGFGSLPGGNPPGTGMLGGVAGEAPVDAHYLYVWIEAKNLSGSPSMATFDHKWGKKGFMMQIPNALSFDQVQAESYSKKFDQQFKKVFKDAKKSSPSASELARLANEAFERRHMKEFHTAMGELAKLDMNDEANKEYQVVVKNYLKVQKELKKAKDAPLSDDPSLKRFLDELGAEGFQSTASDAGHYVLWSNFTKTAETKPQIKHKLARFEEHLEVFYYWFALHKEAVQPALPQHRLVVVLDVPEKYQGRQVTWGVISPVGDGFTVRRDNVVYLSSKRQDALYVKLHDKLTPLLDELKAKFNKVGVTADDLLTGKIWDDKQKLQMIPPVEIAKAETFLLLYKALEDDAERGTITYEGTRQLLVGSGIFPRHVAVPEWVLSGLSSYFESPVTGVYPGVGLPSWTHLISFKYFDKKDKTPRFKDTTEVLFNVVTDRYFDLARQSGELAHEKQTDEKLSDKAKEDLELARCTAWALVYYLASNNRINELVTYGSELNKLPRDMDLGEQALQACAAKALKLGAGKIDMNGAAKSLAAEWFTQMRSLGLRDLPEVERVSLEDRVAASQPKKTPPAGPTQPGNFPPGFAPPGLQPPGGQPPPAGSFPNPPGGGQPGGGLGGAK